MSKKSFKKILSKISDKYHINKKELYNYYLNEDINADNMLLKAFKYQDFDLLKDCFNNIYLPNDETMTIELIGYFSNDNEIIFDPVIKKTIEKKIKKLN